jgi:predicted component of type VI protein secretion system
MTTPTPSAMRGLLVAACALATASAGAQLRMPGNSSATPSLAAPPVTAPARAAAPAAPAAQAPATDETTLKENAGQLAAVSSKQLTLVSQSNLGSCGQKASRLKQWVMHLCLFPKYARRIERP